MTEPLRQVSTGRVDEGQVTNEEWLQRQAAVLAVAAQRPHDPRFGPVFVRGQGARLWDADGRDYIDLTCGYSASNFGHAFEPIVAVARQQLGKLTHLTGDPHPGKVLLAERLLDVCGFATSAAASLAGAGPAENGSPVGNKVLFNATGARAIETAWKAAVAFRPGKLLVLAPGFHGRSIATSVISATACAGPVLDEKNYHVEPAANYPYCALCPLELTYPVCAVQCGASLFRRLERDARQFSAVLVEPALGARGYVFPPDEFFQRLRELTRRVGILMIADEIQTGLGRCGDWLLSHRQGWQPDLVVLGKSLGGGIAPISAVVGRGDVLDAIPAGAESETFAATPLACSVALAVLAELQCGPWMARGIALGEQLRCAAEVRAEQLQVQAVEGLGACCVLELARQQPAHAREKLAARGLAEKMLQSGLLVHYSGPQQSRLVLLPPLTMSTQELEVTLARLKF